MKHFIITLIIIIMAYDAMAQELLIGDVRTDGAINVLDIVLEIGYVLETKTPPVPGTDQFTRADVVPDGILNILDIVAQINLALYWPGSPPQETGARIYEYGRTYPPDVSVPVEASHQRVSPGGLPPYQGVLLLEHTPGRAYGGPVGPRSGGVGHPIRAVWVQGGR